jgi:diacylglycerol kinase (ATP)
MQLALMPCQTLSRLKALSQQQNKPPVTATRSKRASHPSEPSPNDAFVRHANDASHFSLVQAFSCAAAGIVYAFKTQRNMKIHAAVAVLAILLAALLCVDAAGWVAIILCIAAVFSLEILNTAIESVVDLVSPDFNLLAKHAKDCAAGAVYVAAIGSVIVGCIVYIKAAILLFL